MNDLLRKSLLAAVASVLLAAPPGAQAVYLNSDGVGNALIYPYYTAQAVGGNPFNTYITVTNTGTDAKTLRVRFREALKGAPVLSFNLFLAPYDGWAGAVVPFGSGTRLLTNDLSCTDPPFPVDFAPGSVPYLDFSNAGYVGDGAGDAIGRTREGFIEILEMATLAGASMTAVTPSSTGSPPINCAAVRGSAVPATAPPSGSLSGTLTLINVTSGMDFTVRADALAQLGTRAFYRPASDPYPDFNASEIDPFSTVLVDGTVYASAWPRPVDAVSATLMRSSWLSEYILDNASQSRTDVVLTFPTRNFYVKDVAYAPPFNWVGQPTPNCPYGPRDEIGIEYFNREERPQPKPQDGFGFPRPFLPPQYFCVSSTVLSISNGSLHSPAAGASGVVGASSTLAAPVDAGVQNGWLEIVPFANSFASLATSVRWTPGVGTQSVGGHTHFGLPIVGFTLRTFVNGTLICATGACQGNYGGAYPLRYRHHITP